MASTMPVPRCKRSASVLAALGFAIALFLVVLATSELPSHFSSSAFSASWAPEGGRSNEPKLRGSWEGVEISVSRVFRRLAGGVSPRAPAGHPYFTDDEAEILEAAAAEAGDHTGHAWHKPLHPIDGWDVAGVGLACIGLMIAAAGGIGGGGILVPLYILVLRFHPKHAIPLSNITIFGGAITNTVLNLSKRHPDADRPLVDWDLILVMEPLTIGGALVGSFINKVRHG